MMKKASRLLGNHTIDQLSALYIRRKHEPAVLRVLRDELTYRNFSKTEMLRNSVSNHFSEGLGKASPPVAPQPVIFACIGCATRLRLSPAPAVGVARCPRCGQEYDVSWQSSSCIVQPRQTHAHTARAPIDSARLTLAEAYKLVGASPKDSWEPTIKKACRLLMQQLHPDKSATAPQAVQKLAETEFKRVKQAYEMLEKQHQPRQ